MVSTSPQVHHKTCPILVVLGWHCTPRTLGRQANNATFSYCYTEVTWNIFSLSLAHVCVLKSSPCSQRGVQVANKGVIIYNQGIAKGTIHLSMPSDAEVVNCRRSCGMVGIVCRCVAVAARNGRDVFVRSTLSAATARRRPAQLR